MEFESPSLVSEDEALNLLEIMRRRSDVAEAGLRIAVDGSAKATAISSTLGIVSVTGATPLNAVLLLAVLLNPDRERLLKLADAVAASRDD